MSWASISRFGSPPPVTRARKTPVEEQADQEERWDGDERAQQGVDAEDDRVVVRQVHPQHHEVALREVDHAHDAEDEGEADAHEGVDAPTRRPVTTYWVSSLATTARREGALLVPDHGTRGQIDRHHREGLTVLPLDDQGHRADAAAALVEPDASRIERGGGRPVLRSILASASRMALGSADSPAPRPP